MYAFQLLRACGAFCLLCRISFIPVSFGKGVCAGEPREYRACLLLTSPRLLLATREKPCWHTSVASYMQSSLECTEMTCILTLTAPSHCFVLSCYIENSAPERSQNHQFYHLVICAILMHSTRTALYLRSCDCDVADYLRAYVFCPSLSLVKTTTVETLQTV